MPEETRDERLLWHARRGDEAALVALYERHHAAVFRFAYRLLDSRASAEDVTHDCFLDLVREPAPAPASDFDPARGTLRNYLYGMARHRAHRLFRRAAREQELDDGADERRADESCGPLAQVLGGELSAVVRRAVAELPEAQRESLVLFEYEGLSLAEIAAIVGADVNAVKARLWRARQSLKKTLAPYLSPCGTRASALKD
ncbi:MAG TPA: sigma-70 family RNA polymerase sigma factor [Pyrinomonadaceae bacterium]|nr:sigma-70 family RNA polymerase sigma factor [Pyrinomonadaceae bacterium]